MKYIITVILILLTACDQKDETKKLKNSVAVSNFFLYWSVQEITGKKLKVYFPKISGDPAFWQPSSSEVLKLSDHDLIFINGATYEKWLKTTTLPKSKTVNTSAQVESLIVIKNAETHEHNGTVHAHDGTAFTTWLNPDIMKTQINTIVKKLCKTYPDKKDYFLQRQKKLLKKWVVCEKELSTVFKKQKKFIAQHPVYQYLAQYYNLDIKSFHWEPEIVPSEEELKKLDKLKNFSPYILYEDEPSSEVRNAVEKRGFKIIVFRQCGNSPPSADYAEEMRNNLQRLIQTIKE